MKPELPNFPAHGCGSQTLGGEALLNHWIWSSWPVVVLMPGEGGKGLEGGAGVPTWESDPTESTEIASHNLCADPTGPWDGLRWQEHCKKRVFCYTPLGVSQVVSYTPLHSMRVFTLTVFTVFYDTDRELGSPKLQLYSINSPQFINVAIYCTHLKVCHR